MAKRKKLLSVLLAAGLLAVSGCGTGGEEARGGNSEAVSTWKMATSDQYEADAEPGETDDRAFQRFENPVDIHIGMAVSATDTSLKENGETVEDNFFIRYLREKFNINVIVDWYTADGESYNQKVSTLIASNSLPDALVTSERNYMLMAAKDGQLADLGDVFNQYASRQVLGYCKCSRRRGNRQGILAGDFLFFTGTGRGGQRNLCVFYSSGLAGRAEPGSAEDRCRSGKCCQGIHGSG